MLNIEKYKDEIDKVWIEEPYELHEAIDLVAVRHGIDIRNSCLLDWLCAEYKEPILTEEEREYLKAVCKPFHEKVEYIEKDKSAEFKEYISICVSCYEGFELPCFERDAMYKGMELNKRYTLEELGINYD